MGDHAKKSISPDLWRSGADAVVAMLNVAALVLVCVASSSAARAPLVTAAFVIGSGLVLSAWVSGDDVAHLLTVVLSVGVAWCIGLSLVCVGIGYWHPIGLSEISLGCNAVALGLIAVLRGRRLRA